MKKSTVTGIKDIAYMGMAVALIEAGKAALSFAPNIELTSFWIIMFTLFMGWKVMFIIPAFIAIEAAIYGVHVWVLMYLYIWPLLAVLTMIFRKNDFALFWAILSGFFGLFFGALCAPAQILLVSHPENMHDFFSAAFTWWVSGIPWDVAHGIGNFVLMLVLYRPIRIAVNKLDSISRYGT